MAFAVAPLAACESNLVEPIAFGRPLPFLTPIDEFFVKVGAEVSIPNWTQPDIAAADWALTIDGLAASPRLVRFADLEDAASAGESITLIKTMRCVVDSNDVGGLIGTALWEGVPLTRFLDPAEVPAGTRRFRVFGSDGFSNNFPVERLSGRPDEQLFPPLLVTRMNGQPLPAAHGGPVRLLLNESFGYKNVKWIERIAATASDTPFGTYQDAGFADDGEMAVVSRITDPIAQTVVPAGPVRLSGFAVSGAAPIDRVEVAVNTDAWQAAETPPFEQLVGAEPSLAASIQATGAAPYPFRAVWTTWRLDTVLSPGPHDLAVRAFDGAGGEQPAEDQDISDSINAVARFTIEAV